MPFIEVTTVAGVQLVINSDRIVTITKINDTYRVNMDVDNHTFTLSTAEFNKLKNPLEFGIHYDSSRSI